MRDVLTRVFDEDFWLEPFGAWRVPTMLSRLDKRWFPRVDVSETDTEVRVVADVPGVQPEDIDIEVEGNRMTIAGRVMREEESVEGEPYRYERTSGSFRREIALPAKLDEESVRASSKNGILTIVGEKLEPRKKGRIKVETEE